VTIQPPHYSTGFILLAAAIVFNVWYDLRIWFKEKRRPHKKGWRLKAVTSMPALCILFWVSEYKWYYAAGFSIFMAMSWFLLNFDGFYNAFRGFGFFYRGTNDIDDAKTDNFFQSIPMWLGILIKLILFAGSTYLYAGGLPK
jgi:Trk-type K+ transport system membrane component